MKKNRKRILGIWSVKKINKQLIVLLCSIIIIYLMVNFIPSYEWEYKSLLKSNLIMAEKYAGLTEQKKLVGKLGMDVKYLFYLNAKTPEDAIIIMPPDSVFVSKNQNKTFNKIRYNSWASYFVYPRELVYEDEKNNNPLYSKATHVAVVNYWGYEKVGYKVPNKKQYSVLPFKKAFQ